MHPLLEFLFFARVESLFAKLNFHAVLRVESLDAIIKPCLVCTVLTGTPPVDGHGFEQCPLLLNHDLLKTQVKGFCSVIMRGQNVTKAAALEHTIAVTFEEIESNTSIKTDRDAPPDTVEVNQLGAN